MCVYICPFSCSACIIVDPIHKGHIVHPTSISTGTENRDLTKILDRIISAVRSKFIPKFHSSKGEFDYFTFSVYQLPPDSKYSKNYCRQLSLWAAAFTAWTTGINHSRVGINAKGPLVHSLSMDLVSSGRTGESKTTCP